MSAYLNTLPRWVVFMSFHMLSVSSGFCYKELFLHLIPVSKNRDLWVSWISQNLSCALSVFWWNWHAALPAVEPGVTHSNTALTFSLLLCSSGHNSLTLTFFLSFVSPLVLSYTPLSMIPFISLYPALSLSVLSVSICSRTNFCLWSDSSTYLHLTAGLYFCLCAWCMLAMYTL